MTCCSYWMFAANGVGVKGAEALGGALKSNSALTSLDLCGMWHVVDCACVGRTCSSCLVNVGRLMSCP